MTQPLASRAQRLSAALLDAAFGVLVTGIIFTVFNLIDKLGAQDPSFGLQIMLMLFGIAIYLLMHGYTLGTRGQTLGKLVLGIQVVSIHTGQIFSLTHLLVYRMMPFQLIAMIPIVGPVLILIDTLLIFRKDRRCMHDILCGSKVVAYSEAAIPRSQGSTSDL